MSVIFCSGRQRRFVCKEHPTTHYGRKWRESLLRLKGFDWWICYTFYNRRYSYVHPLSKNTVKRNLDFMRRISKTEISAIGVIVITRGGKMHAHLLLRIEDPVLFRERIESFQLSWQKLNPLGKPAREKAYIDLLYDYEGAVNYVCRDTHTDMAVHRDVDFFVYRFNLAEIFGEEDQVNQLAI